MSSKDPSGKIRNSEQEERGGEVSRRSFLRIGALAGAGAAVPGVWGGAAAAEEGGAIGSAVGGAVEEMTIAEMQAGLASGQLTSVALVNQYLARIQAIDESKRIGLNSILTLEPRAHEIARQRDRELRSNGPRGPLHGIPILLKDNIDTASMQTTAGSLALVGAPPVEDATVARKLKAAGAILLGKANLSEWANFRGFNSSSGWSAVGGQTRNPHVLDRNPCGSSSGSAASVAASLCAAALGTETDGSIVCPASACGVVGIKPTVGLTSRAGVVPISHTQDTVGPHGRTVADAAAVLGALTGVDPRDPATARSAGRFHADYTQFLDPDALNGTRIGVARHSFWGYSDETDRVAEEAIQAMRDAGAVIVDPADIPNMDEINSDLAEIIVLVYEFKRDLNAYLATRTGVPVGSLADVIAFNEAHAEQELKWFGQEWMLLAEAEIFSEAEYLAAVERGPRIAGPEGIDAALALHGVDALIAPTGSPAWPIDLVNGDHFLGASSWPAAMAGYPLISVPAGEAFGLPVGMTFMGGAWSEPTLIRLASGFEHVVQGRGKPEYLPTLPLDEGVALARRRAAAQSRAERLERAIDRLAPEPKAKLRRVFGL